MRHFSRLIFTFATLLLLTGARAASDAATAGLEAYARVAAGASVPRERAQAREAFFAGLASAGPDLDARLRQAWTGYLLATDDREHAVVLDFAATLPSARARMLIGSYRGLPGLRRAYVAADKAHTALIAPAGDASPDESVTRVPARDRFESNAFDAPHAFDLWEDAEGLSGRWLDDAGSLDIVAYPSGNYRGRLTRADGSRVELLGFAGKDSLELLGPGVRGELARGVLALKDGAASARTLRRVPVGVTSFAARPAGARVLLDATTGLTNFRQKSGDAAWTVLPDGSVEIDTARGSLFSRDAFGDARIYLEFCHAFNRESLGPRRGNSGLYVMNAYEVQLVDSFGEDATEISQGSIYHIAAPATEASAPPLEWQSLEVDFRAPRFDAAGVKTASARMSVWLNGKKIHDDVEVPNPTAASAASGRALRDPVPPQPLMLQNHGNRVRFRNLWVLPAEPAP